jgi:hypothetical protein
LVTGIITTIIPLIWVRKNYELTVDWISSAKIVLPSSATAILTYVLVSEMGFSSLIRLIIGMVFFAFVFIVATLLIRTINNSDIENLCNMADGLGMAGKIFIRILNIYQKLMETLKL